jgi:hypothetical protein
MTRRREDLGTIIRASAIKPSMGIWEKKPQVAGMESSGRRRNTTTVNRVKLNGLSAGQRKAHLVAIGISMMKSSPSLLRSHSLLQGSVVAANLSRLGKPGRLDASLTMKPLSACLSMSLPGFFLRRQLRPDLEPIQTPAGAKA